MRTRILLALLLLAPLGALAPVATGQTDTASAARAAADRRPNVVLIMTDDMAASDLRWMPHTRRLIGRVGMTFDQGLAPNPMCCPARATVLTGQESHNNGVWSNSEPQGGFEGMPPGSTLPDWLQGVGYRTAFVGKHLNGYRAEDAANDNGWNTLDALVRGVYSYRSFATWDDGKVDRVRGGYVTDHLTSSTRRVVRRFERDDARPFFAWVSHVGPHNARDNRCSRSRCWGPPVPADRDRGDFAGVSSPSRRLPSFNHRNDETKPPFLRNLDPVGRRTLDTTFRRRIETLQAVDRSVAATVRSLRNHGELDRTLLAFTSDHGYLLGQHRYVGKRLPYEEALRVPLLVRGPGVRAGVHTDQMATTADLSRTIVAAAGAVAPHPLDGVSLLPALAGKPTGRSSTILQTGASLDPEGDGKLARQPDDRGWLYRGYRDERWTYARYPDPAGPDTPAFEELYDRARDPYQLRNLALDPAHAPELEEARARAAELEHCAGDLCHPDRAPLSGPPG